MTNLRKVKLGDLLVNAGYITADQLKTALERQKETGGKLGEILINLKYIDEANIIKALSEQLNIKFVDLKKYPFNPEIIKKLPERVARRHRVILLEITDTAYTVGMADPTDLVAYDELTQILHGNVQPVLVIESDLLYLIDLVYRRTDDITSFAKALKEEMVQAEEKIQTPELGTISAEAAPVVKLLNSIFEDAIQTGASDIHIEPDEKTLRIRQRIDGVLQEHVISDKQIVSALVLRIKLMCNMNISEKRLPQDGRLAITVKGRTIDVRVASMPVYFGETVVLRLLDQSKGILRLEQLGMTEKTLQSIKKLIHKPNGMIVVTGPTGSGKTTTLYGMLNELNHPEKKIITIEDPVEYVLPRVNQVQVNLQINLTFSNVLRASMRHDPDIIMVGEMRDEDTVKVGLRAAMTGHLVFSTLHTNDAVSSVVRLIDMGAEGFLVAGGLRGILAQRLVRRICAACSTSYIPLQNETAWINGFLGTPDCSFSFKRGAGCSRCNGSGFKGRIGIYEFLEITPELADALRANDTNLFVHTAKKLPDFKSLTQVVFEYATAGVTTLSEVFKISGDVF
jgi:MSHA biogenesis protein MshE